MRILQISDFYHPYVGGVEQHVRALGKGLTQRGHKVSVATLWHEGLPETEMDGSVQVFRLRGTMQRAGGQFATAHRRWAPPFPDPEITLGLRQIIKRERPEIIHGHDWLTRSFIPLQRTSRARLVLSLHYYTASCAKKNLMYFDETPCSGPGITRCLACAGAHYGGSRGPLIALANKIFGAAEWRAASQIISVSHATLRGNGIGSENEGCKVIPNFLTEPDERPQELAPYLEQLPTEPFFLFVGDLRRLKGVDVLLEAYRGLVGAPPLVLIGKVWAESPTALPANTFVFQDWPNAAVLGAWERSFAGIVPSLWQEPFGIVVIEALSRGKPVIGSRVGGIPDIITDGTSGLLVTPGNADELRSAMQTLVTDDALYRRLSRGAVQRAKAFHSLCVLPQIERVYAQALGTAS